jgi:hypothetical protein
MRPTCKLGTFFVAINAIGKLLAFEHKTPYQYRWAYSRVKRFVNLLPGTKTIERPAMNTRSFLSKARTEAKRAETQAAADAKAAQLARQLAQAAKLKLKRARKLSKLAKKLARRAEKQSEESSEALKGAQAKQEKLQERIRKEQRKNKPARRVRRSKLVQKASPKPKLARGNASSPRNGAKSKPKKTAQAPTRRVSPVQPRPTTKPVARDANAQGATPTIVNAEPAKPKSPIAPEPKPVPATSQKLGDLNRLPAPGVDAPSSSGEESPND